MYVTQNDRAIIDARKAATNLFSNEAKVVEKSEGNGLFFLIELIDHLTRFVPDVHYRRFYFKCIDREV